MTMIDLDINKIKMAIQEIKTKKGDHNSVHIWLYKKYGKAKKCENKKCNNESATFDWAKLKNKEYEFKRDNFIMLCRSCHYYYDEKFKIHKKEKGSYGKKETISLFIEKNKKSIANLIKEIRMKCLITQAELADWSGVDQASISIYEKGVRKPGLKSIRKIIDVANEKAGMDIKYTDIER
jgi:DNA-binding XRE family transcriptional regulator